MTLDFHLRRSGLPHHFLHFFDGIGLADGSWCVMASKASTVKRKPGIDKCQMYRMANEIVNQDRHATHPERVFGETQDFFATKVMRKQVAAYQIEALIRERQGASIGYDGRYRIFEMRPDAVENGDL